MLEKIKKIATWKKFLVIAIIFVIYYITPMKPGFSVTEWAAEANVTLMDFHFGGYDAEEVYHVLDAVGAEGRDIYVSLIGRDCIMAILYGAVLLCFIGCLLKIFQNDNKKCNFLLLCPIIAALSDWIENLSTFYLIKKFPNISSFVVAIESTATTLKFTFIVVSVIVAAAIFICGVVQQWQNKTK